MTTTEQDITAFILARAAATGTMRLVDVVLAFDIGTDALADILRSGRDARIWTFREDDYSFALTRDERAYAPRIGNQPIHIVDTTDGRY